MTMLSSMSLLLGSMRLGDGQSLHLQQQSHAEFGGVADVGDMGSEEEMAGSDGDMACGCKGCMNPSCCCKMKHEEEPPCGCKGCKNPKCCCKMHACKCHVPQNPRDKPCGCKGCNMPDCCCHKRLCCNDPPEVLSDPLDSIPTDDENLAILLKLYWPLRDVSWHLDIMSEIIEGIQSTQRRKRNVKEDLANSNDKTESISPSHKGRRAVSMDKEVAVAVDDTEFKTSVLNQMVTTIQNLSTTSQLNISLSQLDKISSLVSLIEESSNITEVEAQTISPSVIMTSVEEISLIDSKESLADMIPVFSKDLEESNTESESINILQELVVMSVTSENISRESAVESLKFAAENELGPVIRLMDTDTTAAQVQALDAGEKVLEERKALQEKILAENITLEAGDPSFMHQMGFKRTDELSLTMSQLGVIAESATMQFAEKFSVPHSSIVGMGFLGDINECSRRFFEFFKPNFYVCDPCNPYRNIDGSCNNLKHWATWGVAFTSYRRVLPAVYGDGISTFRNSVFGTPLPSARLISTRVNRKPNTESESFSILHMSYGQFLDHDLAATPLALGQYGGPVRCCEVLTVSCVFGDCPDPNCAPIEIPVNDPFYSCHGQFCMEFVRSAPAPLCRFGPRNQINQHTAYIDGSVIYGVTPTQVNGVRSFVNGQLKAQLVNANEELLPRDPDPNSACNQGQTQFCFRAGDGRVNEQILLTFLHTLFAREHNRLASSLKHCNPTWDDEKLFQEARRIIGAELQQVTYHEFVPTLIGPTLMTHSNLYPLEGVQQTTDYDPSMNSAIANEFAAAAYRFGHSQIADNLLNINKYGVVKPKELNSYFFHPFELYNKHGVCDIGRGGTVLPDTLVDPYFTQEVAGKLFRGAKPWGLDLLALNIQRGRDHGLAPYNRWRVKCGLPWAFSFSDLLGQMTQERINALSSVYRHVYDIDLYVGGISENPIAGGIMGPTFTCLLHSQFLRIKRGDRYWFEYKHSPGRFTTAQMEQLHNVTLAGIMCNNIPELDYVQRWPLRLPGPDNPVVCCKSIRQYKLDPWKEDCMVDDRDPYVYC